MCGICGFLGVGAGFNEEMLHRMNARIVRRGPDGAGHYFDSRVGLAMRRLAIIDLGGGQQPIFNEDKSACVVFNGEIYNYREVRRQLQAKGHRFSTDSDTEVIVHLYDEYGADLPRYLEGMFAFALWDLRRQTLLLARDRLGIKPLYIARLPQGVLFGSEMKSLLETGLVPNDIDLQAVDEYLTYTNIPCPRTIYRAITQLEPGTTLTVQTDGTATATQYWSVPEVSEESRSEAEWILACETNLRAAVESHLVSDVPVGAFLSGGVDSGLLVALMADILGRPVETFTVGFQGAGSAFIDERTYARALVERYGLSHHEIDTTPNFEEIVWDIVEAFDQPFADDSVIPSYYVSKAASQHVKVAMTGLGGDELFGGYRRHLGLQLGEYYARIPSLLRRGLIEPLIRQLPDSRNSSDTIDHLKRFIRSAGQPAELRYQDSMATLAWEQRRKLFTPDVTSAIDSRMTSNIITSAFGSNADGSVLERALRTDLRTYLLDDILTLTDRLSMWHSLELRVPFLDHRFVELAGRIPANLKIRGSIQKYLLKKIAERWLPRDMIYHKKQGFEAPMGRWLRGPLLPFFDSIVNASTLANIGLFNTEEILRLRNEHIAGRQKNNKVLFSVLMFCLWHQRANHPTPVTA
ncbi:asparagine synthase [Steroidobacter denitrificans]|uniref:asparagine synthase (glutamine-hydrolyzing) n=2 Tax=Steroidobacter denitrificans TaxID=465721 RepID=A0A127FCR0_STEDE|nr:asparagine synthase [Steroidobacter denitrificans]